MSNSSKSQTITSAPADRVLTVPDGCTKYRASSIEPASSIKPATVIEVRFDRCADRSGIAEWCLTGGRPAPDPFAYYSDHRQPVGSIAA